MWLSFFSFLFFIFHLDPNASSLRQSVRDKCQLYHVRVSALLYWLSTSFIRGHGLFRLLRLPFMGLQRAQSHHGKFSKMNFVSSLRLEDISWDNQRGGRRKRSHSRRCLWTAGRNRALVKIKGGSWLLLTSLIFMFGATSSQNVLSCKACLHSVLSNWTDFSRNGLLVWLTAVCLTLCICEQMVMLTVHSVH